MLDYDSKAENLHIDQGGVCRNTLPTVGNGFARVSGQPVGGLQIGGCQRLRGECVPAHSELPAIKRRLYDMGAKYASMSGSGSSIYGIFTDRELAATARHEFMNDGTIEASYLLKCERPDCEAVQIPFKGMEILPSGCRKPIK